MSHTPPEPTPDQLDQPSAARLSRRAAFVEDVAWMACTGETVSGAVRRLRIQPRTLRNALDRAHRRDLWDLLKANTERGWTGPTATPLSSESRRAA